MARTYVNLYLRVSSRVENCVLYIARDSMARTYVNLYLRVSSRVENCVLYIALYFVGPRNKISCINGLY